MGFPALNYKGLSSSSSSSIRALDGLTLPFGDALDSLSDNQVSSLAGNAMHFAAIGMCVRMYIIHCTVHTFVRMLQYVTVYRTLVCYMLVRFYLMCVRTFVHLYCLL